MDKKLRIFIISWIAFCLLLFSVIFYFANNVNYQLKRLKEGNANQKIKAISFLSDKRILSIIPILIENIDNQNRAHWRKDPKGGLTGMTPEIRTQYSI